MRVLIVNTSERTGGAAVAASRLMEALKNNGVKAKMLVGEKESGSLTVVQLPGRWRRQWHFLWERLCIFCCLRFRRQRLFEVDIANAGSDITRLPEFREADVVHLHWVNQGLLSLGAIRKILASGKPVVWTLHDLWPATSICHYARQCPRFKTGCHHCRLLPGGGSAHDLSWRVWNRKARLYSGSNIHFVACSRWLAGQARQSGLLSGLRVSAIPNAIDQRVYAPGDRAQARQALGLPTEGRLILFVSQRVTDQRKGMAYFVEALRQLVATRPDMAATTGVLILGGHGEELAGQLPLPAHVLGYVNDEQRIVQVYNAADVYCLPSLEDNLPNTLMEALACGVPCVGFRVGGIPEMIDHRLNGYVARAKDAADLAEGMGWVLQEADGEALRRAAVAKVSRCYSQQAVALAYTDIYNEVMALRHFNL